MSVLAAPSWLAAWVVIPLLVGAAALGAARARRRLGWLVHDRNAGLLVARPPAAVGSARLALTVVFLAFAIAALARPRWGRELSTFRARGVDVLAVVDVSRSMAVEDLGAPRLSLAARFLTALAEQPGSDRLGLVAFAGRPHLLCPLTEDRAAFRLFLGLLSTELVPAPGTDLAAAIGKAVSLLEHASGERLVVVISDGESLMGDTLAAAQAAAEAGVRIHTVGIGTPAGQPIPERDGDGQITGYHKDAEGKVVTSRLDEETLAAVARATGGRYFPLEGGGDALAQLGERIAAAEAGERTVDRTARKERFTWPLGLATLALLAERILAILAPVRARPPAMVPRSP